MASKETNVAQQEPVSELAEMQRKLAALEKAMAEKDAEIAEMRESANAGLKVIKDAKLPYCGPTGGYKFTIRPRNPEKYPHLKPVTMNACDESELIRWYCAVNEEVAGSNKRLDPVKCSLVVTCNDERNRRSLLAARQKLANIRARIDMGANVKDEEQALIDEEYARLEAERTH